MRRCAVQRSHRGLGQNSIALVYAYRTAFGAGAGGRKAGSPCGLAEGR